MSEEQVFCISRKALIDAGFLKAPFSSLAESKSLLALESAFIPRKRAETDDSWKQLIPYQLFLCGGKLLVFQRGGKVNEKRLAGRCSVGIGGHMNDRDLQGEYFGVKSLEYSAQRERNEELVLNGPVRVSTLGIINDDSDPVGRVHLGLVLLCSVASRGAVSLRNGAEDLVFKGWWSPEEVLESAGLFENWSILAVKLLLWWRDG